MEIKRVALVIFDISGYTDFIRQNRDTLAHAHEVVSQLLENIVAGADFPLVLNKFEGDAAFMYADTKGDERRAAQDVARQVFLLFPAFAAKVAELAAARESCPCGACQNIRKLRLKAVAHMGEAAFRQIRQFEELAGEDVIIAHRLLKNSIASNEYVLMTEPFRQLLDQPPPWMGQQVSEHYADVGTLTLTVFMPSL
jgi:hypothetical protein